ncbi:hypothetical protein [Hydrogenophaga sp. BPS33]|uniref:hypothetical protein n=1 Tax=Hydrogenophaga sp. BPS33 TaxID=2651974 RepID=UPI0013203B3C|nr:hypothetical protein [Hydrogenophaga sp. BPS33]QHE87602.1 hypothetical protein F9K07_23240 [Hydrogenophaga sp. BPS33]
MDEVVDGAPNTGARTEGADPSTTVSNDLGNPAEVNDRAPQLTVAVQVPQDTSPQATALQQRIDAVVAENRPLCCSNNALLAFGMGAWVMAIPALRMLLAQCPAPG